MVKRGAVSIPRPRFNLRAPVQQQVQHLQVAGGSRDHQRRLAVISCVIRISASPQQCLRDVSIAARAFAVQGCVAVFWFRGVHVCAVREQQA